MSRGGAIRKVQGDRLARSISPTNSIKDLQQQLQASMRRLEDLQAIADWGDELVSKVRRAHLRFEFIGLNPEEQDALEAEVDQFRQLCRCLGSASTT
jgi:hypothetical protein